MAQSPTPTPPLEAEVPPTPVDDPLAEALTVAGRAEARDPGAAEPLSPSGEGPVRERYAVRAEVGRGGMGRVLRVRDADLERDVAMKVLSRELADSPGYRRMFVDEARISGQLEHPNILPVHELGVTGSGDAYFTMKLLEGAETLREVIDRLRARDPATHARFTFDRRVAVVQQVCNALHHAHARGVVHRDIKPPNILLGPSGEVYLVDWGIAALRASVKGSPDAATLVGTPGYMAPEQAEGLAADARSDVYSLTAVLYELLTLEHYLGDRRPPPGSGQWQYLRRVMEEVPRDAESHLDPVVGRIPRMLSRICRRGLAKDPRKRFQSAKELEQALQGWQEGCGPVVCPGTALQRGMNGGVRWIDRHPVAAPALIFGTMALLLAGNVVGLAHALGWLR